MIKDEDKVEQQYTEFQRLVFASKSTFQKGEEELNKCAIEFGSYIARFPNYASRYEENSKLRNRVLTADVLADHKSFQEASFPLLKQAWDKPRAVREDNQLLKMYTHPALFVASCPTHNARLALINKTRELVLKSGATLANREERWQRAMNHFGIVDKSR